MITKYRIARKVAAEGIEVIIANGKKESILPGLVKKNSTTICTRFLPVAKGISGVKKWISHSDSFAKGEIYINRGAKDALLGEKASSLLPVGILDVKGTFEKDDIIRILDESGIPLGVGRAGFDSLKTKELMGQKGNKPIIHYDYLYLD
jgi:glutamate 5-kinase